MSWQSHSELLTGLVQLTILGKLTKYNVVEYPGASFNLPSPCSWIAWLCLADSISLKAQPSAPTGQPLHNCVHGHRQEHTLCPKHDRFTGAVPLSLYHHFCTRRVYGQQAFVLPGHVYKDVQITFDDSDALYIVVTNCKWSCRVRACGALRGWRQWRAWLVSSALNINSWQTQNSSFANTSWSRNCSTFCFCVKSCGAGMGQTKVTVATWTTTRAQSQEKTSSFCVDHFNWMLLWILCIIMQRLLDIDSVYILCCIMLMRQESQTLHRQHRITNALSQSHSKVDLSKAAHQSICCLMLLVNSSWSGQKTRFVRMKMIHNDETNDEIDWSYRWLMVIEDPNWTVCKFPGQVQLLNQRALPDARDHGHGRMNSDPKRFWTLGRYLPHCHPHVETRSEELGIEIWYRNMMKFMLNMSLIYFDLMCFSSPYNVASRRKQSNSEVKILNTLNIKTKVLTLVSSIDIVTSWGRWDSPGQCLTLGVSPYIMCNSCVTSLLTSLLTNLHNSTSTHSNLHILTSTHFSWSMLVSHTTYISPLGLDVKMPRSPGPPCSGWPLVGPVLLPRRCLGKTSETTGKQTGNHGRSLKTAQEYGCDAALVELPEPKNECVCAFIRTLISVRYTNDTCIHVFVYTYISYIYIYTYVHV